MDVGDQTQIKAAVSQRLLSFFLARRLSRPSGQALYAYKFNADEYTRIKKLITEHGAATFGSRKGRGLGLLYLAEWFRRERDGGSWNWTEPFEPVNLRYCTLNTAQSNREISHSDIARIINEGLQYWMRPEAQTDDSKKYLWAVVREAGFPIAAASNNTSTRRWIEKSVEQMFRGVPAETAVNNNAYRFNISDLRDPLSPIACQICEQVFDLKQIIIGNNVTSDNAIAYLDTNHGNWLSKFPIDASAHQFRTLIETVITTDFSDSGLFEATRFLERVGNTWHSKIRINLSGEKEQNALPKQLQEALKNAIRARIFLKSETTQSSRPIAILEKSEQGLDTYWSSRSLIAQDLLDLPLNESLELAIHVGQQALHAFEPLGGAACHQDVGAFVQDESQSNRIRFLSTGSVNWTGNKLFLLTPNDQLQSLSFGDDSQNDDEGSLDESHKVLALSGSATLNDDGIKTVWRTGAEKDETAPIMFEGLSLQGAKPTVYLGLPSVWTFQNEVRKSIRPQNLSWRPIGSRKWRQASQELPWGDIEIAVIEDDQLKSRTRLKCISKTASVNFSAKDGQRRVTLADLDARNAAITSDDIQIPVRQIENGYSADLDNVSAGSIIYFELGRRDQRLKFRMRDQSVIRGIINSKTGKLEKRLQVGGNTLSEAVLWARSPQTLIFEARSGSMRADCVRQVLGETPLSVYREEIRTLFSLVDPVHGEISLSWVGDAGWATKIRRYEIGAEQTYWDLPLEQVRNWLRSESLETIAVIPLLEPEKTRSLEIDEFFGNESVEEFLHEKTGNGPWVVIARRADHGCMRPHLIPTNRHRSDALSVFAAALNIADQKARFSALENYFQSGNLNDFVSYLNSLLQAATDHHFDLLAFDIFSFLIKEPSNAVFALLAANSDAYVARLLELEDIASLQWACTPLGAWESATLRYKKHLIAKVRSLEPELAEQLAIEKTLKRLNEIAALEPTLKTHVALAASCLIASAELNDTSIFNDQGHVIVQRVLELGRETKQEIVQGMIRRRGHGQVATPSFDAEVNPFSSDIETRFDASFTDIIRLPGMVGELAIGEQETTRQTVRSVKLGRLYDRDFMEVAAPLAVFQAKQRAPQKQ